MHITRHLGIFSIVFLFVFSAPAARADTAAGIAWLNQTAAPSGAYESSSVATSFQGTAESLSAFGTVEQPTQPGVTAALAFLAADSYPNTENLSRLVLSNSQYGVDISSLSTTLETHQGRDGGFGELPGYGSTSLDTAFAIRALAGRASNYSILGSGLLYLIDMQNADGGFALHEGGPSSPYVSALVAEALLANSAAFNVSSQLALVRDYLIDCIDASGAISDVWQSSLALKAIAPLTTNTPAVSHATRIRPLQVFERRDPRFNRRMR